MKLIPDNQTYIIAMTMAEEEKSARLILDLAAHPFVRGADFDHLVAMWNQKAQGWRFNLEDFDRLMDIFARWNDEDDRWHYPKQVFPRGDTGRSIFDEIASVERKLDRESIIQLERLAIAHVWCLAWENHPNIKTVDKAFHEFPGAHLFENERDHVAEQDDYDEVIQRSRERAFWDEVDRVKVEYECGERDAVTWVTDYMRRGVDRRGRPLGRM